MYTLSVHAKDGPGPGLCWVLIPYSQEQLFPAPVPSSLYLPPILSEPPHLDGALLTGALAGSIPTPTQTLTDTGQGQVRGGEGTTSQSSSCPGRGGLWTASSGQKGLLSGGLGGQGRSAERPEPSHQRPGGSWSCGQLATAAWCGYMARVCTRPHI